MKEKTQEPELPDLAWNSQTSLSQTSATTRISEDRHNNILRFRFDHIILGLKYVGWSTTSSRTAARICQVRPSATSTRTSTTSKERREAKERKEKEKGSEVKEKGNNNYNNYNSYNNYDSSYKNNNSSYQQSTKARTIRRETRTTARAKENRP